jgi:hypothetical protein
MSQETQKTTVEATRFSCRGLLRRAATLAGGTAAAVVQPSFSPASHAVPAVMTGSSKKLIAASSTRNITETDSGKVYGCSRDGVIAYKGITYGATTAMGGCFMPPAKPAPRTSTRSPIYREWASPQINNSIYDGRRAGGAHDDEAFMCGWDDGQPSEAVMFWIHGGGMTPGSGKKTMTPLSAKRAVRSTNGLSLEDQMNITEN